VWPEQIRRVFLFAAIPGALAVLALLAVHETAQLTPRAEAGGQAKGGVPRRLLAAIALFTLGNSTDALLLLRAGTIGVPTAQLPLLWASLHLVRALLSWPMGRIADRLGRQRTLISGWLWYALCYAGFALARVPAHAWALFAAYGLVAALTEGTERALVADAAPPETRGRALGIYNLVTGAGLLAASVVAGQVWEHVSPAAALLLGAALAFAASALLGLGEGDQAAFSIAAEDAYGERKEDNVVSLPRALFPGEVKLAKGVCLYARASGGQSYPITVKEVKQDVVVIDLNHPLAGERLFFEVNIRGVRPAGNQEIFAGKASEAEVV